jgi:hypothetical protein
MDQVILSSDGSLSSVSSGVNLDDLVAAMTAAGPDALEEMWLAFGAAGLGTHTQGSSLTDQQLAYDAAIAAGKTANQAFLAAAAGGGAGALLWFAYKYFSPTPTQPAVPSSPPPPPSPPTQTPPQPAAPTFSYLDLVTENFIERSPKLITWPDAQAGARQCIALTQYAIATGALTGSDANDPCRNKIIFLPGSSWPLTTSHNWAAIVTHPQWIKLNYVSSLDRKLPPAALSRTWYNSYSPCDQPQSGKSCDEYPYFSSAQSGPNAGGPGVPASLDRIASADNSGAGGRYGNFVVKCQLTSGGPAADPSAPAGTEFLVIPMDFNGAPPTFEVC